MTMRARSSASTSNTWRCSGAERPAWTSRCGGTWTWCPAGEADEYRTIALSPQARDNIEALVLEDFDSLQAAAQSELNDLERKHAQLTTQRRKLLDAHYAGAIPLDLLKTEQQRITRHLDLVEAQIVTTDGNYETARATLAACLDLTRDCHAAYLEANDHTRRLFNQAFFSKIYIDEDDSAGEASVRVDYNQPFDELLTRLVPATVHLELQNRPARSDNPRPGVHQDQGCPPSRLVELRGFEPLTPSMRTRCATGLRHSPRRDAEDTKAGRLSPKRPC